MNKADFFKIMTNIRMTFPHSFTHCQDDNQFKAVCANWYRFFENDDYEVVSKAVDKFIATDTTGYAPTIGQIKNLLISVNPPSQISVESAWAKAIRAARCDYRYAQQEYDKLPSAIQKAVGSPRVLVEWGWMEENATQFARKEFEKKYNDVLEEEKQLLLSGATTHERIALSHSQPQEKEVALLSLDTDIEELKRQIDEELERRNK